MTAGGEVEPKLSFVNQVEHGKPVLLLLAKQTVRNADSSAGTGKRKKRMPLCNEADRGSKFAPTRKGADFRSVSNHKIIYRILKGESK